MTEMAAQTAVLSGQLKHVFGWLAVCVDIMTPLHEQALWGDRMVFFFFVVRHPTSCCQHSFCSQKKKDLADEAS